MHGRTRRSTESAMALPTIAGTTRVTFRGSNVAGQQWANVMHFRYAGGASTPGITEFTALDAKVLRLYSGAAYSTGAAWLTFCTPDTKLIDATYYNLDGASSPYVISHTQQGTQSAATNSPQTLAFVLTIRTGNRGRRYRGRVYLPTPSQNVIAGATGQLTAATTTNIVTQANGLLADLSSIQWAWGVASYGHGTVNGQPSSWTPFFTNATAITADGVPDVQRRRKQ